MHTDEKKSGGSVSQDGRVIPDYDIHIHTWLSPCGAREESLSGVAAYAEEARRRGLETIGISDHFSLPYPWTLPSWANSGPPIIHEARNQAARITEGPRIIIGCEADLLSPGRVTVDAAFAKTLDYVIVSPTHFDVKEIYRRASASPTATAEWMVALTEEAVSLPFVDVIAHPFVVPEERLGSPEAYMPRISDEAMARLARTAAANAIAFEVNGRMASMPVYFAGMKRFFSIAKGEGARFTVGSDSHKVPHMTRLDAIEDFARRVGLVTTDFLTLDEVVARHQARG
jgi:histidinol phosphatase-like PHP family hydrolase